MYFSCIFSSFLEFNFEGNYMRQICRLPATTNLSFCFLLAMLNNWLPCFLNEWPHPTQICRLEVLICCLLPGSVTRGSMEVGDCRATIVCSKISAMATCHFVSVQVSFKHSSLVRTLSCMQCYLATDYCAGVPVSVSLWIILLLLHSHSL